MSRLKSETIRLGAINAIITIGGFTFHILLGRKFGISGELDCLFVGLTLFGITRISNSYITSLFIPIFNDINKDNSQESLLFVDVVIKWVVIVSITITFSVFLLDAWIVRIVAPGFDANNIALTRQIIRILILALVFASVAQTITLTFYALHYYSMPETIGLLRPIINILSLFLLVPRFGILGVAIGDLLSSILMAGLLLILLRLKTRWSPTMKFYHRKLPELIKMSSKMSVNEIIWSLKAIIIKNVASRFGEGAISLFSYTEKLIRILIQLSVESLAKVYYSRISQWISQSKWDNLKNLYMRALRANMAISLFVASASMVFLPAMLKILFLGSKFTLNDINTLSTLFNIMLIFYLINSFENYLYKVLIALKKVGIFTTIAIGGVIILAVLALLLPRKFGLPGLPISIVFTELFVCIMCYFFTRRTLDLKALDLAAKLIRSVILSFGFMICGLVIRKFITNDLVLILGIMPFWGALYVLSARFFTKEEINILLSR